MNKTVLRDDLKRDEGVRLKPYVDTAGKLTIGVGRNLTDVGISEVEAEILLADDIEKVISQLDYECAWWVKCPDDVQRGLVNLAFNQGVPHLMKNSPRMMACLQAGDYAGASRELLDGPYKDQVGARAERIAALFKSCATSIGADE